MDLSWDHSIRDIVTTVVALDCSKSKDPSMRGGTTLDFAVFPTAFSLFIYMKDVAMVNNDIILMATKL